MLEAPSVALEAGAGEDQGGAERPADYWERSGDRRVDFVDHATDSCVEPMSDWGPRNEACLAGMADKPEEVSLASLAAKPMASVRYSGI
jgi:hypothetical protein